ncbi:MAG: PilT/PilU family type 4a pilus ATPase [Cyanobacteria bacterium]|nr:PilT/PilU family type 4a pilus ATPase [Cyanobacteriota bacterium]
MPDTVEGIVRLAHHNNISDVHLGVGEEPRYRSRGDILHTNWPVTDAACFRQWLRELLEPGELDLFLRDKEYDTSHAFSFVRVRINLLETVNGLAMVMRLIPAEMPNIDKLGLPPVMKDLACQSRGLILVTGPTGSGKTTTMAALINHINNTMPRHIITIEDPVEFVHKSHQSLIRQREVGQHTHEFHNALSACLREDPDVILIGEIRDQTTLATALEASQTGHLVLGTLHTNSAVRTVERVLGMYPPQEEHLIRRSLAESLLAVISQGLIKTLDGLRAAFFEIMVNTDACRDYLERGELDAIEEIMGRSNFDGMQTSNQSLLNLVTEGRALPEEALLHSLKRSELAQSLLGRS